MYGYQGYGQQYAQYPDQGSMQTHTEDNALAMPVGASDAPVMPSYDYYSATTTTTAAVSRSI